MKTANLSDVKNDLSRFVEQVRRGGSVRILVHGVPAADLVPVSLGQGAGDDEVELMALERRGAIRRGKGGFPDELARPGPKVKGGRAVEALLDERRRGR